MVMCAAMSLAGSWPRAPQLFPTPSWFMPNLGRGAAALPGVEGPARLLPPVPSRVPASRVSDLVGNGECCGQADVFVDATTSLSLTHPAHGGQAWEMGVWGCSWGLGAASSTLSTLPGPHPHQGQCHPAHCLQMCLKPRGPGYLVCRRVCSCRCRCHSCERRGGP